MYTLAVICLSGILSNLVVQGQAKTVPKSTCEIQHGGQCLPLSQQNNCSTVQQINSTLNSCSGKNEFCCVQSSPDVKQPESRSSFVWYDICGENKYGSTAFQKRVVGGTEARQGEVPWQAAILSDNEHVCGGALIDDFHVLTAAHCLHCEGTLPDCTLVGVYEVLVGGNSLTIPSANSRRVTVQAAVLHPEYDGSNFEYDIALLRLSSSLSGEIGKNEDIIPVCSPSESRDYNGMVCYFSGWGKTGYPFGPKSDNLQYVDLVVMDRDTCCGYHCDVCNSNNCNVYSYNFCAGYENGGKDACTGDSGGPLVCQINNRYQLVGLNSWGDGCAQAGSPSVYVSVTNFLNWIDTVINT